MLPPFYDQRTTYPARLAGQHCPPPPIRHPYQRQPILMQRHDRALGAGDGTSLTASPSLHVHRPHRLGEKAGSGKCSGHGRGIANDPRHGGKLYALLGQTTSARVTSETRDARGRTRYGAGQSGSTGGDRSRGMVAAEPDVTRRLRV